MADLIYKKVAKALLDEIPTVDAVPVIRCAVCENAKVVDDKGNCWCDELALRMKPDDFCSRGKRRG